MPHEKINHPRRVDVPTPGLYAPEPSGGGSADATPKDQLVVGWNEIGWVQVSVYPDGWSHTGEAEHVELNPQELDLLIKTLRRAKRQAYGSGNRHIGFEDGPEITSRPLFTQKDPEPVATRAARRTFVGASGPDLDSLEARIVKAIHDCGAGWMVMAGTDQAAAIAAALRAGDCEEQS